VDTVTISDARQFSLKAIQRSDLSKTADLQVELICFEAGQKDKETSHPKTSIYQVLEGEALIRQGDIHKRLGKGKLLTVPATTKHSLENAGGGLLVMMATRAL
jgi:quercetin dioxygenase-like cupin family protein